MTMKVNLTNNLLSYFTTLIENKYFIAKKFRLQNCTVFFEIVQ